MTTEINDVLLIGYGNPGRLDDGLGPALAEAVEKMNLPGVTVEADYQLTVEDAAEAARHRAVIFADVAVSGRAPFFFRRLAAGGATSFSSHILEPQNVLALAAEMFGAEVEGFALGIRGYEFNEFGERLSAGARENLAQAVSFLAEVLRKRDFRQAAALNGTNDDEKVLGDGESKCETANM